MRLLAIESSCDETSAAVIEKRGDKIIVHSLETATSLSIHAKTGGIIPESAARMQVKYILPVIQKALIKASYENNSLRSKEYSLDLSHSQFNIFKKQIESIDAIAITIGPGLIGSLLVGVETVKALSYVFEKPIIPVNHLLAHIYANFIYAKNNNLQNISFPFIGLIVSGGHTDLLLFKSHNEYQWLGGTRDDAAGEALDKIGRVLDLNYPAGPEIEKRASTITKPIVKFKSPLISENNFDFSFSGLKTEVIRFIQKEKIGQYEEKRDISNQVDQIDLINQICYATQKAIVDVLIKKTITAGLEYNCSNILIGGGVSANQNFRDRITNKGNSHNIKVYFPEKIYSTDNAAMIGAYALLNPNYTNWKAVNANPQLYFA